MSARRFLAVIQDERGYPATGMDLDPAPPDGPKPPMVLSVVKADDYEALESENRWLRVELFQQGRDCTCIFRCGDVAEGDDKPHAVCRGLASGGNRLRSDLAACKETNS